MKSCNFLFEIGVEELPSGFLLPALEQLENHFSKGLREAKLAFQTIESFSTPRRLTLLIHKLDRQQADEVIQRRGPAKRVAYDQNGNLTKAGQGFLRGAGAVEEDIYVQETDKGDYLAVRIEKKGKPVEDILTGLMTSWLESIRFPKSMHWAAKEFAFARPVRWLVCLLDADILPFSYQHLTAGRVTRGNRFKQLPHPIEIPEALAYRNVLEKKGFVISDRDKRLSMMQERFGNLFGDGRHILEDRALLETVVDLVEYPTVGVGRYDKRYLVLPDKVVTSTLSQHQKCFTVLDEEKKLSGDFVFVSNGNPDCLDLIRKGNEKVIMARLEDAEFYYREDTKQEFEACVERLRNVTFQEDLGTLADKTYRIEHIASWIAGELDIQTERGDILRAAHLCKADLVTTMLSQKEFTKLQGYVGMHYARKSGENERVARAIYEHYMPRGGNDSLPGDIVGAVVALADKMDTVCGITGIGMEPTGSNDPFALRRAANGVVRILADQRLELNLIALISETLRQLQDRLRDQKRAYEFLEGFFRQRIEWLLKQEKIEYDVVESVMHIDFSNVPDLLRRARDLQRFKQREDFIRLVLGFKRVSNIIADAGDVPAPDPLLFAEETEKELFEAFETLQDRMIEPLKKKDYETVLGQLVSFSSHIDRFFDDVLVNVDDESVRTNRYALLYSIRKLFLEVADIARIVVPGEKS